MTAIMLSVDEISLNDEVFIYGTGSVGQSLAHLLHETRPDVRVTFLDSFVDGSCLGHPVLKFKTFVQNATTDESIIIASSFWNEISRNLKDLGFQNVSQAMNLFELHRDAGLIVRIVDNDR